MLSPRCLHWFLLLCALAACGGDNSTVSLSASASNPSGDACKMVGDARWIMGGKSCTGSSSAVVEIKVSGLNTNGFCSASLISSTAALTAAHCFTSFPVAYSEAVVNGLPVPIARVALHPQALLTSTEYRNDVAILHLDHAVQAPHMPILLSATPQQGDTISIFGYGRAGDAEPGILHSGQMRIWKTTPSYFSAIYTIASSNPCLGDSGGPVIFQSPEGHSSTPGIVGVISTGSSTQCRRGDLNMFANIQSDNMIRFILDEVPDTEFL